MKFALSDATPWDELHITNEWLVFKLNKNYIFRALWNNFPQFVFSINFLDSVLNVSVCIYDDLKKKIKLNRKLLMKRLSEQCRLVLQVSRLIFFFKHLVR